MEPYGKVDKELERGITSLYIHIPFCKKKCNYCDFYSTTDIENIDKFILSLKDEIHSQKTNDEVTTIFFGGGTPSILSEKQFMEIAHCIKHNFHISCNCEWTLEVNPESFTEKKAAVWLKAGVNRLSIGIQSLNNKELETCGRIHDKKQALQILSNDILRKFDSISVDLIYGLKHQTRKTFMNSLKNVLEFDYVKHISLYELTNPNNVCLIDEEIIEKITTRSRILLRKFGFERYEISNYARKGHRCRHNLNYWNYGKYLGFGPSAHSFDGEKRYCAQVAEELTQEQKRLEYLMLKLRTADGFSIAEYEERFGSFEYTSDNRLIIKGGYCKLTDSALDFADGIAASM